jgi:hypothetical protein
MRWCLFATNSNIRASELKLRQSRDNVVISSIRRTRLNSFFFFGFVHLFDDGDDSKVQLTTNI